MRSSDLYTDFSKLGNVYSHHTTVRLFFPVVYSWTKENFAFAPVLPARIVAPRQRLPSRLSE